MLGGLPQLHEAQLLLHMYMATQKDIPDQQGLTIYCLSAGSTMQCAANMRQPAPLEIQAGVSDNAPAMCMRMFEQQTMTASIPRCP